MNTATAVPYRADGPTLARASITALLAGAAILVLFVLPAEFGIDPTGVGTAIGLTALSGDADAAAPEAPPAPAPATAFKVPEQSRDSIARRTPFRSDDRTLTLAPHSGIEIKAEMRTGDSYNFTWKATGPVKMDMHGEASLTASDFTTYWKQKGLTSAQGSFTAPFNGIHGWYWRNQGETPVTITLHTDGFYAKLIQPPVD